MGAGGAEMGNSEGSSDGGTVQPAPEGEKKVQIDPEADERKRGIYVDELM